MCYGLCPKLPHFELVCLSTTDERDILSGQPWDNLQQMAKINIIIYSADQIPVCICIFLTITLFSVGTRDCEHLLTATGEELTSCFWINLQTCEIRFSSSNMPRKKKPRPQRGNNNSQLDNQHQGRSMILTWSFSMHHRYTCVSLDWFLCLG